MNSSNKRIAFNTIYLYVRLIVTLIIGLYTSRVVLQVLGVSDYGLYNVVGGIITLFTFISGALGTASSRFFNVELVKEDGDINRCYNVNLMLHVGLAAFIFILAETVGNWYILNKLNVPNGQMNDALFIFQISVISACVGIINSPCGSLFIAFERFAFLTKIDIINTLIRLFGVILMQYYSGNVLRFYSILMCITTINTCFIFHWIASKRWGEIIKYNFVNEWEYYKKVLFFGGWNLLSTICMVIRSTGTDLIINHFFNTAVNGAFALSKTVSNHVTSFSNHFDTGAAPQIIQSYGAKDYDRCAYLVNKMGRFCLLFFVIIFFPLYIELEFILELWLKNVPADTLIFCKINLLLVGVALSCGGLLQMINASGKIKWFKINSSVFFCVCLPIGCWGYSQGWPTYSILILFIIADIMQRIIQLILVRKILGFSSWEYVRQAYARPIAIAIIMTGVLYSYSFVHVDNLIFKVGVILSCLVLTVILVYFIGLTSGEKVKMKEFISNFYIRNKTTFDN